MNISSKSTIKGNFKTNVGYITNKIDNGNMISKVRTRENFQLLEHIIHEMYIKDIKRLSKERQDLEEVSSYGNKIGRNDLRRILDQSKDDIDSFLGLSLKDKPSIAKGGILTIDELTNNIWSCYITSGGLLGASLAGAIFAPELLPLYLFSVVAGGVILFLARMNHKLLNRHDCYYDAYCKKIRIKLKPEYFFDREVGVKPLVDHEYAHFVLLNSLLKDVPSSGIGNTGKFDVFEEGFAEGIEEAMGQQHYRKTGNAAYILPVLDIHFNLLKYVYLDTAKKNSFSVSDALYRKDFINDAISINLPEDNTYVLHAYGKALFKILEHKHGLGIYRKTVNNDLSFL